jgi:hypothetical protein
LSIIITGKIRMKNKKEGKYGMSYIKMKLLQTKDELNPNGF